ncbi:phage terminase large subunit [Vreelandella jeotgali]|uniref:phage terminase large subunit n=1 Tax=Vreelandella jeotgali TaxID=553386 RepID=UPI00034D7F21|nr:phage terminase large subunit [Halomonas jeotgali]
MASYEGRRFKRTDPMPRMKVATGDQRKVKCQYCSECEQETPETLLKDGVCVYCRTEEVAEHAKLAAEDQQDRESRLEAERRERQEMYRQNQEAEAQRARVAREKEAETQREFDRQEEAKRELARRQLAHDHLLPLVMRTNPDYQPGWVHKDICEHLEWFSNAVAAGESPRLMISMPPRSGKSELASRVFPAWHLGRNPKHEIISCSYAGSLANDFSRKVRGLLREKSYQTVFPEVSLSKDSQSVEVWSTNHEGGYVAAGVGGPITGRGCSVLIIDDPLKNRADAESETTREGIWDWYRSTAYTRLAPGGGVICMMTRWHDADLGGKLLEQMADGEGDQWRVVSYPAIAEHDELFRKQGEALHPERFPITALEQIKRTIGPRDWSALYQQNPVADDGDYFKKEDFSWFMQHELPPLEEMNFYTAWDLAIGQTEQNDFTVGLTVGVDRKDNIFVVDVQRGRWRTLEIVEKMLEVQKVWQSKLVGIERGHILMTMGPILEKRIRETRTMMPIEELRPGRQDKIARARPFQARMQQRRVFFRKHCDATMALVAEMMRFPNGQFDDQVDSAAWIGQLLMHFTSTRERKQPPKRSWRDKLSKTIRNTDKPSAMTS